jgi:hypothetical protein
MVQVPSTKISVTGRSKVVHMFTAFVLVLFLAADAAGISDAVQKLQQKFYMSQEN